MATVAVLIHPIAARSAPPTFIGLLHIVWTSCHQPVVLWSLQLSISLPIPVEYSPLLSRHRHR